MGSKGGSNQVQTQEPWAQQAPYLQQGFQQAQSLYNSGGPQYFPGATYTPFSSQTEQGLGLTEQRALGGSPVTDAAQGLAAQSLGSRPQFAGGMSYLDGGLGQISQSATLGQKNDPLQVMQQKPWGPQGAPAPTSGIGQFSQFAGVGQQPNVPGQGGFQQPGLSGLGGIGQGVQGIGEANQIAGVGQGQDFAGSQQLAGVGPTQGLDAATQRFNSQLTGLPSVAGDALTQTAGGQSLGGNPYLDKQFDIASQKVTDVFNRDVSPGIASQFSLAGRTGSDAQADVQTQAAGQVSDSLGQLANSIYGGNYQQERDRQLSAAGQLGALSQGQQGLGLQAAGRGADLYNTSQQQDIARRGLSGSLANQQSQSDIARRGLGADIYGQGQQQDIARRGLESQNLLGASGQGLSARGQDIQSGLGAGGQDIQRRGLAGQLYGQQQQQRLGAAGLDANVYGQQLGQQNQFAGLSNSLANQDYTDIDRLLGVGGRVEGLGNQALQDQMNRFNFYQNAPQNNLANYIASIQGNYGGTTTGQGGGGNRLQGAAGGAMAGASLGPWGALAGGVLGLLG